jgi:hypothetical protein
VEPYIEKVGDLPELLPADHVVRNKLADEIVAASGRPEVSTGTKPLRIKRKVEPEELA